MRKKPSAARISSKREIPYSAIVVWLVGVGVAGQQGYRLGLKIAENNLFQPSQFVTMEFQFPFMVTLFGTAQVVPVATIELLSKIGLLELFKKIDQYLLNCFNGRRVPRLLSVSELHPENYGSLPLLDENNVLGTLGRPILLKRQSLWERATEVARITFSRVAHLIVESSLGALPAFPYVVALLWPDDETLNDPDFQFQSSKTLAVLMMLCQTILTYNLFRGTQWTLSNSSFVANLNESQRYSQPSCQRGTGGETPRAKLNFEEGGGGGRPSVEARGSGTPLKT